MADSLLPVVTRIAVVGSTGRMGRLISAIVTETDGLELVAALHSGSDLRELVAADLVVDVTLPHVSPTVVAAAVDAKKAVLVGTSGWTADRVAALRGRVGATAPGVLIVPNFSIGSVLASSFAERAARWFDSIEIIESHHAAKSDSPSGTAVRTAELMAAARADLGPVGAPHADQRARGQQVASIPIHSLRMDGVVARQEVLFGRTGEQLSIRHDTASQDAYVPGIRLALTALPQLRGVTVGLDVLLFGEPPAEPPVLPAVADPPSGQAASVTAQ
jgi:4-hydroxy-tetrahydrodipicolinate reductase